MRTEEDKLKMNRQIFYEISNKIRGQMNTIDKENAQENSTHEAESN
jgi:hypothetical protein